MKFIESFKHGVIFGLGLVLIVLLSGISYAAWVSISNVSSNGVLTADLVNELIDNQKELKSRIESGLGRNYCYGYSDTQVDITTATWTNYTGFTGCNITSNGGKLKVTMDFSAYGNHYGGIRLIDKNTGTIYGSQATYGMEWVMPQDNIRAKRTITRILDVPAGNYDFDVQIRGQTSTSRIVIHMGDNSQNYSGLNLIIEEM